MQVPVKRFGRTEVQMPVLSCGGMRYQQSWSDLDPAEVEKAGQENVEAIVHRALAYGINHIETARGYGSSEMQLGWILPKLDRDTLLVQTKVSPEVSDGACFRDGFEKSMAYLQLEYVDFLSIHGINTHEMLADVLRKGGALDQARQLQKEGRARFVGFSTHAGSEVVMPCCECGEFDYVNLHWYFINHPLLWPAVEAATKQDMGVFVISPNDKGGQLYDPPEKLKQLCAPLTPMQWHDLFCLAKPEVHTLSLGAARPSDLDEHVEAVVPYWQDRREWADRIEKQILEAMAAVLGADWVARWYRNLPDYTQTPGNINVVDILRLWTFAKGLDLNAFARSRYNAIGHFDHWVPGQPALNVDRYDWSCLAKNPFAAKIPSILEEAHQLLSDAPGVRLSQAGK